MGRAGQLLERLGLGDLSIFDGAEQSAQLIELDLLEVQVMQYRA
jgi:hypothetical protein